MARAADFLVYKNKKETAPPRLREVNAGGSSQAPDALSGAGIDVIFDHVGKGLQAGSEPQGFTLLTPEGRVWPQLFKTTLHGHIARLHLGAKLIEGAQLRYGYGPAPVCNITDSRGHALPVFGPIACQKPAAYLPFVTAWKRTGVVQGKKPLKEITCPKAEVWDATPKTYPDAGFVEDHADWLGHPGLAYFWARLELSEPMKLDFLMGFDGPFRLWLNGKPFFDALDGTNPCLPDEASKVAALKAGSHQITVGMDTNGGRAWGFFLRFCRRDISPAAVANGDYVKPAYCL